MGYTNTYVYISEHFLGSNTIVRKYLVSIANTITLLCCGIREPDKTAVFKCDLMFSIGPFLVSCSISHLPLFCQGRLSRLPKINEGLTL